MLKTNRNQASNGGKISIPMGASHKHGASNCCLANTLVVALTRMTLNPENDLRKKPFNCMFVIESMKIDGMQL